VTGSSAPPPTGVALIRRGPFARLWWASFASSVGDWVTIFATLAIADNLAGGAGTLVAIVSRVLPGLLFGAVAGVVADRVDRRKLLLFSDVGRAVIVPLLALAQNIPTLVLVNLALEFLSLLGQSPRAAVIPRLVPRQSIVAANSFLMGAAYGTIPVGAAFNLVLSSLPAVALGGLIPAGNEDVALAFILDSLTFLLSALLVSTLPMMAMPVQRRGNGRIDWRGSAADLGEGARFLWSTRDVRRVIIGMATALFGGGTVVILGIPFVTDVLAAGIQGFFAVVAALGFGAAAGIAAVSFYSDRLPRRDVVFSLTVVVAGVGLAAASAAGTVAGAAAWMVVFGLGAGAAYVMGFSHLHEVVSDELRGRVFAAMFALMRIGLFVSMAIAVPLVSFFRRANLPAPLDRPTRAVLLLGGLTIVLAGLGTAWSNRDAFKRPRLPDSSRRLLGEAAAASRRFPPRDQGRESRAHPDDEGSR
jgi:dTMP kinase